MLDADLAALYGVTVKRLNEQVKRNKRKFPQDFVFRLTKREFESLRSQIATSNRGGRRYRPFAFTEHGAIMAANILNSPVAVEMSVFVVRAFVRLRQAIGSHRELAAKLAELERRLGRNDETIAQIIAAIKQLMQPPVRPRKQIGFRAEDKSAMQLRSAAAGAH